MEKLAKELWRSVQKLSNNSKKVSIVVPVYNVEKYIDRCLESLVNQTLKDIEIIVVNDGSTDNSKEVIEKYQKEYPEMLKVYTIKVENQSHKPE